MNIDSIYKALDKIDSDRDKIAQLRAERVRGRVIEEQRHPYPVGSVISIIDIGSLAPNAILKPFTNQGLDI